MEKDEPVQVRILRFVKDNPRSSPLLMSERLGVPSTTVRSVLTHLRKLRLVSTIVKGSYVMTELGERFLKEYREA